MAAVNQREVAHRMFAAEFNAARFEVKGTDERAPSYLVSPLGAKANRVFLCGVLTEIENRSESGELWRARVSDPTGVFTIYSGQYQPEATAVLSSLTPPQYVAVVGKTRTYEPEPGQVFVSVRPETIQVVDEDVRNGWIYDCAVQTRKRLAALRASVSLNNPTPQDLERVGVPAHLVDGIRLALEHYGNDVDVGFFDRTLRDALQFLLDDGAMPLAPPRAPAAAAAAKPKGPGEAIETKVLGLIESMAAQDDKGAQWDQVVSRGEKESITEDQVEEALNALMDKGLVYEPILGRLKIT